MTLQQTLALLDDPVRWEYPEGFDYASANSRFLVFVESLNATFNSAFKTETDSHIQDASFHSQSYVSHGGDRIHLIRFSNFGDMVAIDGDSELPRDVLDTLCDLFADHNYRFVPCSVLDDPYTGSNPGVTGIDTWWIRYFDWV